MMIDDNPFMLQALQLAEIAQDNGEVPVGAIIVSEDQVIGAGYNQSIALSDPTAHAEIVALRAAAAHLQNYRLPGTTMYVTLEPCVMCLGALIHARVSRLVYAASDPKMGAVEGACALIDNMNFNHKLQYKGGVMASISSKMLKDFFRAKR